MSDMQREALAVLAEVWALSPDVRLGQLMAATSDSWAKPTSKRG
jgi:hypothetical protein